MSKLFGHMFGKKPVPAGAAAAQPNTRSLEEQLANLNELENTAENEINEEELRAALGNRPQKSRSVNEQYAELERQVNAEAEEEEENEQVAQAEEEAAAAIARGSAAQNILGQNWTGSRNNEKLEAELAALVANNRKGRKTRKARRAANTLRKRKARRANTLRKRMSHRRRR